jgi:GNAT acetyltransferase-like protein
MEDSLPRTTWTILHSYPTEPNVEARWTEFLTRADFPAHYVSPEYFREPFFRDKKPFVVLAWQGERIVGALSGVHEEQQLMCGLRSRPQICFDKTFDRAAAADALVAGLRQEAGADQLITFYSWVPLDTLTKHGYRGRQEEGVVMLDLTRGPDDLFKQFADSRRRNIRKASKLGIEVSLAGETDEFRTYYDIYAKWCERKGIPRNSFEVLEEALRLPNRRLFIARYEGKMLAGTIIRLYPGAMIEYAANSSLVEYLQLRPNDLLHWHVIQWACAEGYKSYSLGGAHLFLLRFGGSIVPVYRYRLDRTWLHRHELKDSLRNASRNMFDALPVGLKTRMRQALKRSDDA